ncbi:ribosylnicotinamide kinase [Spiromyces aspiralis]|uniref:Ribosylnicotinamide kinase n=1 Tax=Spiromyces aspiralis TaxID=68401 RepID=A0ACC1HTJ8_9FUNG|nr:ribosylnicotinamide kinase [Spiromyces aspiralis]
MSQLIADIRKARSDLSALAQAERRPVRPPAEKGDDEDCRPPVTAQDIRSHYASRWANPPDEVNSLVPADELERLRAKIGSHVSGSLGAPSLSESEAGQRVKIVLVDGILLFNDPPVGGDPAVNIRDECDVALFLVADYCVLKQRRETRSAYKTKEGVWQDPPGYFEQLVWPNYLKYHANLIYAFPEAACGYPCLPDPSHADQLRVDALRRDKGLVVASTLELTPTCVLELCIDAILQQI